MTESLAPNAALGAPSSHRILYTLTLGDAWVALKSRQGYLIQSELQGRPPEFPIARLWFPGSHTRTVRTSGL